MKKSLFLVGPHNTGKSKIKELAIKLIGEQNANTLDLETLEARFGSSNIFNKRLIGSNDMSFLKVKELKIFKLLTGGDTLFMENKGENGFNAKYNGVAWFCCNELPKFGGDKGDGVYNRFAIIETNKQPIVEEKQDKKLLEHMFEERDYIISKSLQALKQVIADNYTYRIPNSSKQALNKYKIDNDSFLSFFNECTIERSKIDDNCTCKVLYDVYSAWCRDNNNNYKNTKKEVRTKLESINMGDKKKTKGLYYYSKFTLSDEIKKEYQEVYGDDII
jgi:P4 family phage/plasmid primase-like protien